MVSYLKLFRFANTPAPIGLIFLLLNCSGFLKQLVILICFNIKISSIWDITQF